MNGCCEIILKRDAGREKSLGDDFRFCFEAEFNPNYPNGNLTRIHNTDGGGEDYNMEFDALNRLVRYYEDTAGEKGIFSYNCAGLLAGREVDGDITKFGYDVYSVLDMITKANGDELGFDFDMLGRLRGYGTDSRESTFNYDGTKRFGDFDDGWKRYHWCKSQFLGYEDEANTFYIVPDINGSTKVIFTHAGTVVNRLDYDQLGKIRNQDATPQVELLYCKQFYNVEIGLYQVVGGFIYDPLLGAIAGDSANKLMIPGNSKPRILRDMPRPEEDECRRYLIEMNFYETRERYYRQVQDCLASWDAGCTIHFGDYDTYILTHGGSNYEAMRYAQNQEFNMHSNYVNAQADYNACIGGSWLTKLLMKLIGKPRL